MPRQRLARLGSHLGCYMRGVASRLQIADGQLDPNELIAPCQCRGTIRYVHRGCLNTWRVASSRRDSFYRCEQCFVDYSFYSGRLAKFLSRPAFIRPVSAIIYALLLIATFASVKFMYYHMGLDSIGYYREIRGAVDADGNLIYIDNLMAVDGIPVEYYATRTITDSTKTVFYDRFNRKHTINIFPTPPGQTRQEQLRDVESVPTPTPTEPLQTPTTTSSFFPTEHPIPIIVAEESSREARFVEPDSFLDSPIDWIQEQNKFIIASGVVLSILDHIFFTVTPYGILVLIFFIWRFIVTPRPFDYIGIYCLIVFSLFRLYANLSDLMSYIVMRYVRLKCSELRNLDSAEHPKQRDLDYSRG